MPLNNSKINQMLNWSADCVIISSVGVGTFAITDRKLCVPVLTLSMKIMQDY